MDSGRHGGLIQPRLWTIRRARGTQMTYRVDAWDMLASGCVGRVRCFAVGRLVCLELGID